MSSTLQEAVGFKHPFSLSLDTVLDLPFCRPKPSWRTREKRVELRKLTTARLLLLRVPALGCKLAKATRLPGCDLLYEL